MRKTIDLVKIEFDETTNGLLYDYCRENRLGYLRDGARPYLSPEDFNFHVTVMYSRVKGEGFVEGSSQFGPHLLTPQGFDMFGPGNDLLVIKLRRDRVLEELFGHYVEKYGHVSEFLPYRPHITIKGSVAADQERIAELPLPEFDLRAARIVQRKKSA